MGNFEQVICIFIFGSEIGMLIYRLQGGGLKGNRISGAARHLINQFPSQDLSNPVCI